MMVAVVVAAVIAAVTAVAVAAVWSAPLALQANVNVSADAVAATAGRAIAAWEGDTGVWAAISAGAGGFVKQRLSRARIANVTSRLLAVNSSGDAVIAWETRALPSPEGPGLPPGSLFISYRPAGGRFGRPYLFARHVEGADVGIDRRGDVKIAWAQLRTRRRPAGLYVVERHRAGGYGRARRVVAGRVLAFSLVVNARGDAALVWERGQLVTAALLCAAAPSGRGFGRPLLLTDSQHGAGAFDTGIDSTGEITVAWQGPYDGAASGQPFRDVNVTTVDPDTGAVDTQLLRDRVRGQLGDLGVRLAVNARGDAAVMWDKQPPGANADPRILVARRTAHRTFARARTIGTGDIAGGFDAAIGPTGSLLLAWQSNYRIKVILATAATGPLPRPSTLSAAKEGSAQPTATIDKHGHGFVLWQDLGPDQPPPTGNSPTPILLSASSP